MQEMTFTTTSKDGLTLFGRSYQPEKAKAVISLVHGLGEHSGRYDHLAKWLGERHIAVNLIDLRGHGNSEGKRGYAKNFNALLDDVEALLEYTDNSQFGVPHYLMGHSMGGLLVLTYGLKRIPQHLKGIISQAPALEPVKGPSGAQMAILKFLRPFMSGFTAGNGLNPADVCKDQEVVLQYQEDPLVHDRISISLAVEMLDTGKWTLGNASAWVLPLLLLHGGDDKITSANASESFAEAAGSHCDFKLVEEGFHELHNDPEHEKVYQTYADWILNKL